MTVREGCNAAYFHIVKDMREEDRAARMAGHNFGNTLNERIERFEEEIGLRADHEALALWMHRHVLLPALGKKWEDFEEEENVKGDLPAGISEEHRWRFEDQEWDGLKDFQGNPWELEGIHDLRKKQAGEHGRGEIRETL